MRKYPFASSAKGWLYTVRRLSMSRRPRRICSETELTFNKLTSLSAALLRAVGMRCPKDSFSVGPGCGEVAMVIKPDIFDSIQCDNSP
jgi:hypothetical protein